MNCTFMSCVLLLTLFSLFRLNTGETCSSSPKCSCQFGADGELPMAASGSDGRHVGIAAAGGALGSMVLAGGGFAIWRFIKSRSASKTNDLYGRPPSSDSSTGSWMDDKGKAPLSPRDKPRRGSSPWSLPDIDEFGGDDIRRQISSSQQRNIYRMGRVWT